MEICIDTVSNIVSDPNNWTKYEQSNNISNVVIEQSNGNEKRIELSNDYGSLVNVKSKETGPNNSMGIRSNELSISNEVNIKNEQYNKSKSGSRDAKFSGSRVKSYSSISSSSSSPAPFTGAFGSISSPHSPAPEGCHGLG